MSVTTKSDLLTNLAASCVIIFSLTGSVAFIMAVFYMGQMQQPSHKVLLPANSELIRPMPAIPMLGAPIHSETEPGSQEEFKQSKIMASYQAMHSIYN
jgi:hypothetical protein